MGGVLPGAGMTLRKRHLVFLAAALFGVGLGLFRGYGKRDRIPEIFPPELLRGHADSLNYEALPPSAEEGAFAVLALAPSRLAREARRPTALFALKSLHQSRPKERRIRIYLADDSALGRRGLHLAVAEFSALGGGGGNVGVTLAPPTGGDPPPADLRFAAALLDSSPAASEFLWQEARRRDPLRTAPLTGFRAGESPAVPAADGAFPAAGAAQAPPWNLSELALDTRALSLLCRERGMSLAEGRARLRRVLEHYRPAP